MNRVPRTRELPRCNLVRDGKDRLGWQRPFTKGKIASAKANVHVKDSKIIGEDGFWPTYVYCRPWLSKERFMKHGHFGGKTTGGALTENNSID